MSFLTIWPILGLESDTPKCDDHLRMTQAPVCRDDTVSLRDSPVLRHHLFSPQNSSSISCVGYNVTFVYPR